MAWWKEQFKSLLIQFVIIIDYLHNSMRLMQNSIDPKNIAVFKDKQNNLSFMPILFGKAGNDFKNLGSILMNFYMMDPQIPCN